MEKRVCLNVTFLCSMYCLDVCVFSLGRHQNRDLIYLQFLVHGYTLKKKKKKSGEDKDPELKGSYVRAQILVQAPIQ